MTVNRQYRQVPTFEQALGDGVKNDAHWYRYFQAMDYGRAPSPEFPVPLTGSPFSYTAPRAGMIIVSGGTVSAISFTRTATYSLGVTAGMFDLNRDDILTITYTGAPTVTFVPR